MRVIHKIVKYLTKVDLQEIENSNNYWRKEYNKLRQEHTRIKFSLQARVDHLEDQLVTRESALERVVNDLRREQETVTHLKLELQHTRQQKPDSVYVMSKEHFAMLEKDLPLGQVNQTTTEIQAGFNLGIQYTLNKVWEKFVHG